MTGYKLPYFFAFTSEDVRPVELLRGYAFTNNSLVVNTRGLGKFRRSYYELFFQATAGRFVLFENLLSGKLGIRVDPTGQYSLYYYQDDDFWCIGNSVLSVANRLREEGYAVEPYMPAIDTFKNKRFTLLGGQLLSNNTCVAGIKALPLGHYLLLDYSQKKPSLSCYRFNDQPQFDSYTQLLSEFCSRWVSRTEALAKCFDDPGKLSLSGGVDSRAVLSILSTTQSARHVRCHSNKTKGNEYAIASQLCKETGTKLGLRKPKQANLDVYPEDAFAISMHAHAGCKTNFTFPSKVTIDKQLHYIGGCSLGPFYANKSASSRISYLAKNRSASYSKRASKELGLSLDELGSSPDDPFALFHHYYHYRARYHYGNEAYTNLVGVQVHPLMDSLLQDVYRHIDKSYICGNGVVRDIIKITNPDLLKIPFDRDDKIKQVETALDFHQVTINPTDLEIFYDPSEPWVLPELTHYETSSSNEWKNQVVAKVTGQLESNRLLFYSLGFSGKYVDRALEEVDSYHQNGSLLKASGALLGFSIIFYK